MSGVAEPPITLSHATHTEVAPTSRKRATDDIQQQASKRRRLEQASVLCMRELFRAVVKDGNIPEEERVVLQNVALLLSQVDGKTWVNFPDNQGELREFTPQQLKCIRPFFEKVAEELKAKETELQSSCAGNMEGIDCLKLVDVPWAGGITARELLGVCGPDETLQFRGKFGLLDRGTKLLPSKYMLKSRVCELINYYYIKWWTPPSTKDNNIIHSDGPPGRLLSVALTIPHVLRAGATAIITPVAALVFTLASCIVSGLSWLLSWMPTLQDPIWPALRLFCAVIIVEQSKKFFGMLILIARFRVIYCLAVRLEWTVLRPFVVVAEKLLGWKGESWIIGCSCVDGRVSWLSWLPVRASEGLVSILVQLVEFIPMCCFLAGRIRQSHAIIAFLFDLLFSIGIAEGLSMIVDTADERARPKLVWMSMNVARMLREGPTVALPVQEPPPPPNEALPPAHGLGEPHVATNRSSPSPQLPRWQEEGEWNLFD